MYHNKFLFIICGVLIKNKHDFSDLNWAAVATHVCTTEVLSF